eukprot:CAMPEP_0206522352 /NCGR_PEP_ID=MMETSP0324_2-20121206/66945_1 /ASSEMBLY_ACC=CAM_ASM_000836 /TAXON_ID=2866 /ORGANISM="Crypthecodinium cohnii, Strain Seligo" /LENGTH=125 /DNA_ID=CAMNT_0054016527 /DNA_START=190 /DNA_END=568 /DNA_ORIENTATION=+
MSAARLAKAQGTVVEAKEQQLQIHRFAPKALAPSRAIAKPAASSPLTASCSAASFFAFLCFESSTARYSSFTATPACSLFRLICAASAAADGLPGALAAEGVVVADGADGESGAIAIPVGECIAI